jgi:protoporphyrinogen oxidase
LVNSENHPVVVIGGGPAGLTAAYELVKHKMHPLVLEADDKVGGIARTEIYKGYRFDIGGHRFFTKVKEVEQLWHEILGEQFIKVPRMSRIYYRDKFFDYPLSIFNTLSNLGVITSLLMVLSYLKEKIKAIWRTPDPQTFEEWVTYSFGERLYKTFFKTYTEKVWGIPCNQIQAEWAKQRIKGMSLKVAVMNSLFGKTDAKSLIKEFDYPILGPGMMWERCQELIDDKGGEVRLNSKVLRVEREGSHITKVISQKDGETSEITGDYFVSSMPVTTLMRCLDPAPPEEIMEAANSLSYRDFLIVSLIVDAEDLFADNWIYIHSPEVKVGRIQNFKNWSPKMVPDPTKTCLGMEYFCSEGDEIWAMADSELIDLATRELDKLGLVSASKVEDGTVIRQKKAYPVYDRGYYGHLETIRNYIETFENLQTVGRNGMHRYNNQDHSMLTGLLAAKNILGQEHDLWKVNTERSYHEDFTSQEWQKREKQLDTELAST